MPALNSEMKLIDNDLATRKKFKNQYNAIIIFKGYYYCVFQGKLIFFLPDCTNNCLTSLKITSPSGTWIMVFEDIVYLSSLNLKSYIDSSI